MSQPPKHPSAAFPTASAHCCNQSPADSTERAQMSFQPPPLSNVGAPGLPVSIHPPGTSQHTSARSHLTSHFGPNVGPTQSYLYGAPAPGGLPPNAVYVQPSGLQSGSAFYDHQSGAPMVASAQGQQQQQYGALALVPCSSIQSQPNVICNCNCCRQWQALWEAREKEWQAKEKEWRDWGQQIWRQMQAMQAEILELKRQLSQQQPQVIVLIKMKQVNEQNYNRHNNTELCNAMHKWTTNSLLSATKVQKVLRRRQGKHDYWYFEGELIANLANEQQAEFACRNPGDFESCVRQTYAQYVELTLGAAKIEDIGFGNCAE